jgi:ATP-dependent RNA helicase DeaD
MDEFKKLGLGKNIIDSLRNLNFRIPTDIQRETIPTILKGIDVIGNAATGSGKTLAFASGIIENCIPRKGVQAMVLAPTRELVEQISKVMRVFAENSRINIQEVYGGASMDRQIRGIRNAEVIIGTPGRTLDHLKRRTLDLSQLKILVLDEADRIVDMGFLPDMERILDQCPRKRQTMLFSATTSNDISHIEKKYMQSPKRITVETYVDASQLQQYYYDTPTQMKFSLLVHLLKKERTGIVMVFCNTRRNVDFVSKNLERYNIDSQALHGGLAQNKRSRVMEMLHRKEADILICTDVAARGIDIDGVTHIYNYDLPKTSEEYIHRIGRTARAGKKGMAISILSDRDYENFRKILSDESLKIEAKELPKLEICNPIFQENRHRRYRSSDNSRRNQRDNSRRNSRENSRRNQRDDYRGRDYRKRR